MVIVDSRRKQNGTTIVYDLVYVNDGSIIGSDELINRFIIFGGRVSITGGDNTTNEFILTKPDFLGKINPGQNSTNVFDFHYIKNSALEENILKININYQQSRSATQRSQNVLEIKMNSHSLTIMESVNDNFEFSEYSYIGREEEVDEFSCTGDLYHNFVVNSGGAYFGSRDIIENCSKVIIGSNVDVIGGEGNYTFYIEAAEYLYGNSYSRIDVKGTGTIIFTGINLLDDSISITYFPKVNTLHIERRDDGRGNSYSLGIKNYIEQSSNKPNFVLINKDGNNVVPEIKKTGITRIDSSKLYEEYSLNDFSAVKRHYHTNILNSKESYKVIEIIKNEANNSTIVFGSSGNDIIILDKETVFVEGGNGNDMYVIDNDTEEKSITIDNHSDDKKLDTILMQEALGEFGMQGCDLYLNLNIRVKNYLQGDSYKHFIVMNKKGETFIPYVESMLYESELYANSSMEYGKLVPFFHATQTQNMFLLPEDFQDDHVVINSRLEDIERYKDKDDLLLIRESGIPFIIRIENFYNDRNKWIGINFLLWNNGNFSYFDLPQEIDEAVSYQDKLKDDYEEVIKEYVIDFTGSVNITHNQDDTLTSVGQDEERVGVVILENVTPDRIRVSSSDTDLVFFDEVSNHVINVKNWNNSESYRISTLEFDLGLEPIIIRRLDRFSLSDIAEIQDLINKASEICQKKTGCEANIEAKNNDGQTLFHVAAQEGKLRSIRFFISKIESMNFEDNLYAEPDELVKAVRQRERLKSLINEKDKFGYTPLQYAAKNGKWDIVNLFLDKTAERNPDDVANKDRFSISWTTVHYAVYNSDLNLLNDIFQFLSDKNTVMNMKDSSGWAPLHYAVYYNALDVVKFLVNKGADINAKDKNGKTLIDIAKGEGHNNVINYLEKELNKEKDRPAQRKRRHHGYLSRKPLAIDLSNQHEVVASSSVRPSSWISDLFGWVKSSIGELLGSRAALPETSANYSNTAGTSQFNSEVCISNNVGLGFFLLQSFLDKKYPLPNFCSVTPEEALADTLSIVEEFEKTLEKTAKQSGVLVKDVNFFKVYLDIAGHVRNERYSQIPNTLYSSAKEACPKNEKFLSTLKGNIEKMFDEQQIVNSGYQPNDIANNKPRSYLNNTTVDKQLQGSYHAISS